MASSASETRCAGRTNQKASLPTPCLNILKNKDIRISKDTSVLTNAGGILSHSLKDMFRVKSETQLSRNYANL